jgi:flagellar biogenesis protein FliO
MVVIAALVVCRSIAAADDGTFERRPVAANQGASTANDRTGITGPRVVREQQPRTREFTSPLVAAGSSSPGVENGPQQAGLPLAGPSTQRREKRARGEVNDPLGAVTTVLGSLAVVLGLFFVVVYLAKRTGPRTARALPEEAFQILGRSPFGNRMQVQLIRIGNKLVLLNVTAQSVETITEITDEDEVQHLTALCRASDQGSISDSFRSVLGEVGEEPAEGFLEAGVEQQDLVAASRSERKSRRRGREFEQWG